MNWEEAVQQLKRQDDKQELVEACFYDDPLIDAAKRYHKSTEWKELKRYLPKQKGAVLDIGAGRGISSYAFAKDGWGITALEPDPSDIVGAGAIKSLAQEEKLNIKVIENWGEKLPFEDAIFDVVYMRQALHHAKDLTEFCKEAGRVLKKGGLFVATREHVISKKEDLEKFLDSHPLHNLYGGENAFLLDEYKQAIRGGGMEIANVLRAFESDINLFPHSRKNFKIRILKFLEILYQYIPWIFPHSIKAIVDRPGRIYSFFAKKL